MKKLLLFIWQFPQMILGKLLLLIYGNATLYNTINYTKFYNTYKMLSGISLGDIVILRVPDFDIDMKHEYGHSIQSHILGPLYLIVIGLPSILGNIYDQIFHKNWSYEKSYKWYYNQPWEKWADKLGGVTRKYNDVDKV